MRNSIVAIMAVVVLCACAATASDSGEPVRLDGATDAAAERSFGRMMKQADQDTQMELLAAVIKLNMAGVQSAVEVVADTGLQSPSITRIRERVDGMTAEEIVEHANSASDVTVEVQIE